MLVFQKLDPTGSLTAHFTQNNPHRLGVGWAGSEDKAPLSEGWGFSIEGVSVSLAFLFSTPGIWVEGKVGPGLWAGGEEGRGERERKAGRRKTEKKKP